MKLEFKILRIKNGLSQKKLAERLGTYQKRISRLERGEAAATADELKKLKKVLLNGLLT